MTRSSAGSRPLTVEPVGIIETPFRETVGAPIQASRAGGAIGRVRIGAPFRGGLKDLEGFERIWLTYWFHRASGFNLLVTPFLDVQERGVFATRAPRRPVPIGISVVRLLSIGEGVIEVAGVDMLDGTPLLDVRPYVPEFDSYPGSRAGWFDESNSTRCSADDRFDL
jgi:tRNA-Thr(GGU) m(6)t(6)A37 methyltransferase TsaA